MEKLHASLDLLKIASKRGVKNLQIFKDLNLDIKWIKGAFKTLSRASVIYC
jgi:hypothetical protein